GSGSGGGVRMDAGIARLGDDAQLRVEFSADRSSLESVPGSYTSAERILTSQEENRRFSYGLTVIENLWRIGEGVQTYASFGLGVTHSRITGEMRRPCGPAYTCNVEGVAYGFTSDRDHRGTYALVGAGVVARLQG